MNEEKLKEAVSLYKQGQKSQAAVLLGEIVRQDPNNSMAWYGLALSVDELDKRIYCLKKVVSLDPKHQKAHQLLEKLQSEKNFSPANEQQKTDNSYQPSIQKSVARNFIKKSLNESTGVEKKLIFVLIGMVLLLVICASTALAINWTKQVQVKNVQATAQVQAKNAQTTATAEYTQCSKRFENEMVRLLSQFFR